MNICSLFNLDYFVNFTFDKKKCYKMYIHVHIHVGTKQNLYLLPIYLQQDLYIYNTVLILILITSLVYSNFSWL